MDLWLLASSENTQEKVAGKAVSGYQTYENDQPLRREAPWKNARPGTSNFDTSSRNGGADLRVVRTVLPGATNFVAVTLPLALCPWSGPTANPMRKRHVIEGPVEDHPDSGSATA